jgi:hypothetical protein
MDERLTMNAVAAGTIRLRMRHEGESWSDMTKVIDFVGSGGGI